MRIQKLLKPLLGLSLLACLTAGYTASTSTTTQSNDTQKIQAPVNDLLQRPDVIKFIDHMHTKYNYNTQELKTLFANVKLRPQVIKKMNHQYEATPWYKYQKTLVSQTRIKNGVAFWDKYQDSLTRAQKQFGVPASIIVATIGIESNYGGNKGSFKVFDSLANFAFNYPRRQEFFTNELEQYLLLTREQHLNPATVTGSYAGAIGQPQFMPSSFRAYAVDFANTKQIDIVNNEIDVIGSIANYYHKNGWRTGKPVVSTAKLGTNSLKELTDINGKPNLDKFKAIGITPSTPMANINAEFLTLDGKAKPEYWLAFRNFYVIKKYNPSNNYAMAIYQLSQEIDKARKQQQSAAKA